MLSIRRKRFTSKLVVAIDIGTTNTAASFCITDVEGKINYQEINRWPKQIIPDAKIPSLLYYDSKTVARLFGAETEDEGCRIEAESNGWNAVHWWKLLLCPDYLHLPTGMELPDLPAGLTVDVVFRDQFSYIMKNLREFIIRTNMNGEKLWDELSSSMCIVLTTPSAWEGKHQNRMREALINTGVVNPIEKKRIRFVAESEAAIHYCMDNIQRKLQVGNVVLVCDVGGGTTDIGIYKVNSSDPINLEEILSPTCLLVGGVFINDVVENFVSARLKGSKWGTQDYIQHAMRTFERQVKRSFKGTESYVYIPLDGSGESSPAYGVVRGRLQISRTQMFKLFAPCITKIKHGLQDVLDHSPRSIDQVFVVGGFAESEYVYREICSVTEAQRIPVLKPNDVLSKAIAHGALSWHFNSAVQLHIARFHYGAETDMPYTNKDSETAERRPFQNALGEWRIRGAWSSVVFKGERLHAGDVRSTWFHQIYVEGGDLEVEMKLFAYRWDNPPTFFEDKDGKLNDGFIHIGTVKGNLTECFDGASWEENSAGKRHKALEFEVCLFFDEIEIKACLRWRKKKRVVLGEATIVYDV